MQRLFLLFIIALLISLFITCQNQSTGPNNEPDQVNPFQSLTAPEMIQGYYKDVFVDAGVGLTKIPVLPSVAQLGLSSEFVSTENTVQQNDLIVGTPEDLNGVLLYPDGAPRFRAFYSNGGSSVTHGSSLGEDGRNRIRTFYANGGNYVGSCAGSALFSMSRELYNVMDSYYKIWPGRVERHLIENVQTNHSIPPDSPLLQYHDFGNDHQIDAIQFWFGNNVRQDVEVPSGTEVLLYYDVPAYPMDGEISSWAYKESSQSGRGVVIGCHPEYHEAGEQLVLTQAMFLYALDGSGGPQLKGTLENGIVREMNRSTADNEPEYTKLGDKQVHHFRVQIPAGMTILNVSLDGEDGYHLNVFVHKENFAFQADHDYSEESVGSDKTIQITNPEAGEWYIGVECYTTVQTIVQSWGYEYAGPVGVLNGVAYQITADWQ